MDISIAVIGLAGQLFSGIVASYGFLAKAKGLDTDAPVLLWKLRIQEIRLKTWGRYWGFEEGKFDEFLQSEGLYNDVIGILTQIKALLDDAERLRLRYGVLLQVTAHSTSSLKSERSSSEEGDSKTPRIGSGWTSKFRWAVSDKNKFEELVVHLKDFNDGLHSLLRYRESVSLNRAVQSNVLNSADQIEEIRLIQAACATESSTDTSGRFARVDARNSQVYSDLKSCAKSKELHLQLQEDASIPPPGAPLPFLPHSSLRKPRTCLRTVPENSPSNVRIFGEYRSDAGAATSLVLVEWKDYDQASHYNVLISQRVDNLARLLSQEIPKPSDFRVLSCVAYVEDSKLSRFGFAYALPPNTKPSPPISLLHLMARAQDIRIPDLGERFRLAQALAISIMRFHDCNWLHGAVRSANIMFFEDLNVGTHHALSEPFILGFNYSRPSDPSESTLEHSQSNLENDLYRHPDVSLFLSQNRSPTRYRRCHELYSLGIVLLEIGLWEQIKALWKDHYDLQRFSQKLLDSYVPKLGAKMGAVYRDVVRTLLTMEIDRNGSGEQSCCKEGGAKVENEMYWRVIKQLERCRA